MKLYGTFGDDEICDMLTAAIIKVGTGNVWIARIDVRGETVNAVLKLTEHDDWSQFPVTAKLELRTDVDGFSAPVRTINIGQGISIPGVQ